ncbi:MAG TPA: outer membrane protein assembly factor BamD [Phycisphaerae bacterium]|nr:outer membrane protein assembly factor BamD [Phycisphaerae bacterium]
MSISRYYILLAILICSILMLPACSEFANVPGLSWAAPPPQPSPGPISPTPAWVLKNGVWVPVVASNPTTPEGEVAYMMRDLNHQQYKRVIKETKQWLKLHPNDPLVPQVLLVRGDALDASGDKYGALFPYEDLLNNFPNSPLYGPCLTREYDIAIALLNGYKRKFLGMQILTARDDAIRLLERIQDRQRGSPLAELAGIQVADYQYRTGDFDDAQQSYEDFIRRYPYSQFVTKATLRQIECLLGQFRGVSFDMTPLHNAQALLQTFQQNYPELSDTIQVQALQERIYQLEGENELQIAEFYWRFSKPHASQFYYLRVIDGWPDTIWAQQAQQEMDQHFGTQGSG